MNDNKNINFLKHGQSWQKAEKMLDRHFRMRRIIIWSLSIFSIGLVTVSSILFVNKSSKRDASTDKNSVSKRSMNVTAEKKNIADDKKSDRVFSPGAEVASLKTGVDDHSVNLHPDVKTETANPVTNKVEKGMSISKVESSSLNIAPVATNPVAGKTEKVKTVSKSGSSNLNTAPIAANHVKGKSKKSEKENSIIKTQSNDLSDSDTHIEPKENSQAHEWTTLAYMVPIQISQIPIALGGDFSPVPRTEDKPIVLPGKKFDLKLSVYGAAHYVSKNVQSTDFAEYADRRKKEEEGIITASMGVSLSHAVKDFSINIGFEYSAWGEKNLYLPYLNKKSSVENGHYQDFNLVTVDTAYIWGNQWLIYDTIPDSTFISHLDTITKSEYDASVYGANSSNRFYFFEVPVEISYRFTHSKIGIGATAGISPAWLITKRGYYLNKDVSGIELISDMKSINTFIVNGRFSLDLYYKVCDRFNILLRPQIKANLNSIFKSEYGINQRYYATGLVFGLQYSIQ